MNSAKDSSNTSPVQTEAGNTGLIDLSDEAGGNQASANPLRSLATLRLLARERLKVYGSALPDGFQLPAGVTLEDLLKSDANPK
jgi:hypothetical protein